MPLPLYDNEYLVVGAGLSGATIAHLLAKRKHRRVLVVEKENYLGGNSSDYEYYPGALVSRFGAHIFHTRDKSVWDFIRQFDTWSEYKHTVGTMVNGKIVPFPISISTLNSAYGLNIRSADDMKNWLANQIVSNNNPQNAEEYLLTTVGNRLYRDFYAGYSKKQWGMDLKDVEPSVVKRVEIRFNHNTDFFPDEYQGIPNGGYSQVVHQMLSEPNINVMYNTDIFDILKKTRYLGNIIYTGKLDQLAQFLGFDIGHLQYRCIRSDFETHETSVIQPYAVINYPDASVPYTRTIEYKKIFSKSLPEKTIISREYVDSSGIPSYPLMNKAELSKADRYRNYVLKSHYFGRQVHLSGRLANYRYYNMDQAVAEGMRLVESLSD